MSEGAADAAESTAATRPAVKILHEFNGADKSSGQSNLVQLPDGEFLGMTLAAVNTASDAGTIYELKSHGEVETLATFAADGSQCAGYGERYLQNSVVGRLPNGRGSVSVAPQPGLRILVTALGRGR